jgi:hypothetical protein
MLHADKLAFEANLAQDLVAIQMKELDYLYKNLANLATARSSARRRRLVVVALWPRRRAAGLGRARATPRGSRATDVAPRAAEEQEECEARRRDGRRGVAVTHS